MRGLQSSTSVMGDGLPEIALCHLITHYDLENSSVISGWGTEVGRREGDIHTKTQAFFPLDLHRRSPAAASQPPVSRVNPQGKPHHTVCQNNPCVICVETF